MGTAWASEESYPWEHGYYVKGIETVKVNIMLRIYSNKWHVYAGLAILNPSARIQIDQYARSTTEIYKLMLAGDEEGLRGRIYEARDKVFGTSEGERKRRVPILLTEDIFDRFSLGKPNPGDSPPSGPISRSASGEGGAGGATSVTEAAEGITTQSTRSSPPPYPQCPKGAPPNSHLSLLAMVDCWAHLGIHPYVHLELAATPIFRMWIGVAEYLFRSQKRLDAAIQAALYDVSHRSNDLEFVVAARGWSQCISFGSFELYKERFGKSAEFFKPRFEEATRLGSAMIQAIMDSSPDVRTSS